jgi:hypothetical protein
MTFSLEYHSVVKCPVQRSIPAALPLFGMLLLLFVLVASSPAQVNAATSSGSAHSVSVMPSSTAAPAHNLSIPSKSGVTVSTKIPHPPQGPGGKPPNNNWNSQRNTANGTVYYPYLYPAPYAADAGAADSPSDDDDPEYQGGPTIFDRRGSGAASYIPPVSTSPVEDMPAADSDLDPEPPQAPTILVFKDGHQLEVANYAIVSQTLYDLTPGHPRKIALADLDLPATEKQNDDHGIVFQLPPSAQAN